MKRNEKLKVLPLETWMKHDDTRSDVVLRQYKKQLPIYDRDGIYLLVRPEGSWCWFEVDGLAYKYPESDFVYRLTRLNTWFVYNKKQIAALREAISQRVATKDQIELVRWYDEYSQCRNTYRKTLARMLA